MEDNSVKAGKPAVNEGLTVAKINAAIKILEWSREAIEPGIGGTPNQLHVALADAFRVIYGIVSDAVVTTHGSKSSEEIPEGAIV